jgi:sensor histidine kinase regulating citrate/malate metabolism
MLTYIIVSHYLQLGDNKYSEILEDKIKLNNAMDNISEGILLVEDEEIKYHNQTVNTLLNISKQDEYKKTVYLGCYL